MTPEELKHNQNQRLQIRSPASQGDVPPCNYTHMHLSQNKIQIEKEGKQIYQVNTKRLKMQYKYMIVYVLYAIYR